jgi:ABC-type transporter Mla maintaining outer membrane lipid asymmetry permease subunit MlaE
VTGFFGYLGGSALLAGRAFREALLPPYRLGLVVAQIHAMGVHSLVLTVIAGLFAGMVVALVSLAYRLSSRSCGPSQCL